MPVWAQSDAFCVRSVRVHTFWTGMEWESRAAGAVTVPISFPFSFFVFLNRIIPPELGLRMKTKDREWCKYEMKIAKNSDCCCTSCAEKDENEKQMRKRSETVFGPCSSAGSLCSLTTRATVHRTGQRLGDEMQPLVARPCNCQLCTHLRKKAYNSIMREIGKFTKPNLTANHPWVPWWVYASKSV